MIGIVTPTYVFCYEHRVTVFEYIQGAFANHNFTNCVMTINLQTREDYYNAEDDGQADEGLDGSKLEEYYQEGERQGFRLRMD